MRLRTLWKGASMQLMYVVDLDVEGAGAYDRILHHIASWVSGGGVQVDPVLFENSGTSALAPARTPRGNSARVGTWETLDVSDCRALKLVISQTAGSALEVSTRVTATNIKGHVHFRVGIARETTSAHLVPVETTDIFQPRILRTIDEDPDLVLKSGGQIVSGEYIQVKTTKEAHAVSELLATENRLPLAVIHVRSRVSWELAREVSRKLLGLVRTVTVNFETANVIKDSDPEARVPFGGMAIIWPGFGAPSLRYTAEQLSEMGAEEVRRNLMKRLGPLSALGNGVDSEWRQVRSMADSARISILSEEVSSAREGGDKDGEISALEKQVEVLQQAKLELASIGEEALQDADSAARTAQKLESERDQAREESAMWQKLYRDLSAGRPTAPAIPDDAWESIPKLESGADPEATFLAIVDASSGRIVFTDRARKSWTSIDYPEPEDMTEKLITLARAATVLYDGEVKSIPHLDDWLKREFNLSVALTDQTITKWKRKELKWLNSFEFEGENLNATPHVKVRDAVKFNECGRIHFALEAPKSRLVVQHVGVKAYE